MSYGEIKIDTITFTAGGVDTSIAVSGLVQNPTFTGNITTTGTISGDIIRGNTVSGVTVTGGTGEFGNLTAVSGVFTTQVSGATVTGNVGLFTTITGGTVNLTSGVFASGTAAAPSVSIGTTDNGLYSPGADQVAISTNGTGRLFVDASGRISVANQFTDSTLASNIGGLNVLTAGSSDNNALTFAWNHQNLTTEIEQRIEWLFGDDASANNYKSAGFIGMGKEGTWQGDSVRDSYLAFATTDAAVASEKVRITSDGKVGIGTGAPGSILTVQASGTQQALFSARANAGAGGGMTLQTDASDDGLFRLYDSAGAVKVQLDTDGGDNYIALGNVGIGSSTPQYALDVNSSASPVTGINSTNANGGGLKILNSGTDRLYIGSAKWILGGSSLADESALVTGGAYSLIFGTNGAERARIDSSGRLGIGTTSPAASLEIARLGTAWTGAAPVAGTALFINNGNNSTTSPSYLQISAGNTTEAGIYFGDSDSNGPGRIIYDNNSDSLRFHVSQSERARIDSSGRLLVGTSTSTNNSRLNQKLAVVHAGNGTYPGIGITGYTGTTANAGPFFDLNRSRGTSDGSMTSVASGDVLGFIVFRGSDGTNFVNGAEISAFVDGTPGANDMPGRLVFSTTADGASSPTERMRIAQDGAISTAGILTAPSATVFGTFLGRTGSAGLFETSRNVGAGVTTATIRGNAGVLNVHGDGDCENTNNSYGAISDIKLKENIADAGSQWDDLKALQVRKYNFKAETGYNTHTQIGLIAQEVELVSPGLVGETIYEETGESTKSVNYSVLYMKAVKALQEAMERIETLEAKVAALESA